MVEQQSVIIQKAIRDIIHNIWQLIAITLVLTLGLLFFTSLRLSYENLYQSSQETYEKLRFADLFVSFSPIAEKEIIEEVSNLENVEKAEGRFIADSVIQYQNDIVQLRLVGINPSRSVLNTLQIVDGRKLVDTDSLVAVLESHFAKKRGVKVGDDFEVQILGIKKKVKIIGIANSPEYIFPTTNKEILLPSPSRTAILFLSRSMLAQEFFSLPETTINEISVTYKDMNKVDSTQKHIEEIITQKTILKEVVLQKDQPSNAALNIQLDGYYGVSIFFPLLFLLAASISANLLFSRLLKRQQRQIGTMRGMGIPLRLIILMQIIPFFLILIGSIILGLLAGIYLGKALTDVYAEVLGIPFKAFIIPILIPLEGIVLVCVSLIVGAFFPLIRSFRIPPANAIRFGEYYPLPPQPKKFERKLFTLFPVQLFISFPIRNLFRYSGRTIASLITIIFSVSLTLGAFSLDDSVKSMLDRQFNDVELWHYSVVPIEGRLVQLKDELTSLPYIQRIESSLEVPAELVTKEGNKKVTLIGLDSSPQLHNFSDSKTPVAEIFNRGEVITTADYKLEGKDIEILLNQHTVFLHVAAENYETIGKRIYLSQEKLEGIYGKETLKSRLLVKIDKPQSAAFEQALFDSPNVLTFVSKDKIRGDFDDLLKFFRIIIWIFIGCSMLLSPLLLFANSTMRFYELRREIATIRVLGAQKERIMEFFAVEGTFFIILGTLFGLPAGFLTSQLMIKLIQNDFFVPLAVQSTRSILISFLTLVFSICISFIPAIIMSNRISLPRVTRVLD